MIILRKFNILFKLKKNSVIKYNKQIINLNNGQNVSSQSQRYLHLNVANNLKIYMDKENEFAHDVLERTDNYNLFQPPFLLDVPKYENINEILKNCNQKLPHQIFDDFKILSKYCQDNNICISNDQFDEFVDAFTEKCHHFTDHQLIESLKFMTLLPQTPFVFFKNFMELWLALDDALCAQLENWKIDQALYACECWYSLNLSKKSKFVWQTLRKIGRKIKKLDKNQMVHSLFFCNLVRKPLIDMFDYEVAWKNHFDQMNIQEIGVMSMGFFKTETPVRSPDLIEKIYKRLITELNNVEDITLVNILKILRYSSKTQQAKIIYELLDKLCPHIDKISLLSCLHVALMGCDLQLCHDKNMNLIINRFNNDILEARLKDLERITHTMSLYNIPNLNGNKDELCRKILNEIPKRINEIVLYPKCFSSSLHYLALCGHHDNELINVALDPKILRHTYGTNLAIGREIFCLDSFARINLAGDYNGNLLTSKNRATMGKFLTHYIPERNSKFKLTFADRILLEVKETFENMFKYVSIKHVLPHYQRPDVIFCYDKVAKKAIPLGKNWTNDYGGVILTKDKMFDENIKEDNIISLVIVITGWNNYVRNTERLTGLAEMKLKQLELLNHKYIVVPWYEWIEQENENDRQKYLKRKLISHIEF